MKKYSPNIHFSQNLNSMIRQRGLTVSQTANRVGMNKTTLHNYCNGVIPRHIDSLRKLADFFGVSLDQLIGTRSSERPSSPRSSPDSSSSSDIITGDYIISIRPLGKENGSSEIV